MLSVNASAPASGKVRVLVVEDEPLIAMLIETMLEDVGFEVVATASTLKAGLAAVGETELDLAILDMMLGREPSFAIADMLNDRGVPFLFASGNGELELPEAHAARHVLSKPFAQADLQKSLAALGLG